VKILLLSQWYFPEPGPRVHELAEELADRGHDVTVLTGFPSYPNDDFYDGYRLRLCRREKRNGVAILRVPHFPHARSSGLRRVLNYCSFMLAAMTLGNLFVRRADCMYVFMPPPLIGIAAKLISICHRIPLVYDIQDIWPDAVEASAFRCSILLKRMLKIVEKIVYPFARAISVPTDGYRRNLIEKGVARERIEVIPNWANEQVYRPLPYDATTARQYGAEGKFTVVHAGNMGYSQSLQTVVDAAALLADKSDVHFVLAGEGAMRASLISACQSRGLTNVLFTGHLPVETMPELFSIADLLLIHLRDHPAFRIVIPSKTQAYMACGKPILMAVEGDASDFITMTHSGLTCPSESPEEMAAAILRMYGMRPEERRSMGENARDAYMQYFQKRDVIERYQRLLYQVAGHEFKRIAPSGSPIR
jgi:glycosyltransferase involved in cell wall biosynthesis